MKKLLLCYSDINYSKYKRKIHKESTHYHQSHHQICAGMESQLCDQLIHFEKPQCWPQASSNLTFVCKQHHKLQYSILKQKTVESHIRIGLFWLPERALRLQILTSWTPPASFQVHLLVISALFCKFER